MSHVLSKITFESDYNKHNNSFGCRLTEIFDGRANDRWAYGDLFYDSVSIKLVDETNGMRITGLKKKNNLKTTHKLSHRRW